MRPYCVQSWLNECRGFFHVAVFLSGLYACITCYLAIWLPYVQKIRLEWSVYCPRMIPTATMAGFSASFCFHCAFWPVWGVLTPAVLSLFFIASLMTAHFLPSIWFYFNKIIICFHLLMLSTSMSMFCNSAANESPSKRIISSAKISSSPLWKW